MARRHRHKGKGTGKSGRFFEKRRANRKVRYAARDLRGITDEDEVAFVGRGLGCHTRAYDICENRTFVWRTRKMVVDTTVEEILVTPQIASDHPWLAGSVGRRVPVMVDRRYDFDKSVPEAERSSTRISCLPTWMREDYLLAKYRGDALRYRTQTV